jgi:hypothetical protein
MPGGGTVTSSRIMFVGYLLILGSGLGWAILSGVLHR